MALKEDGRLAIRETLKLAWWDVMSNWKQGFALLVVLSIPSILLYATGTMKWLMSINAVPSWTQGLVFLVFYLLMLLFSCAIYVLFIRLFLVGPQYVFRISAGDVARYALRFIWKGIQFALLTLAAMMVLAIPYVVVSMFLGFIMGALAGGAELGSGLIFLLSLILWLAIMVVYMAIAVRVYPTFFGTTLGQVIRFRESWRTMHGYTWRTIMALVPPIIIKLASFYAIWVLMMRELASGGPAAMVEFVSGLWWVGLVMLPVSYISYGWAVGILSHIYKDMWPAPAILDTPVYTESD